MDSLKQNCDESNDKLKQRSAAYLSSVNSLNSPHVKARPEILVASPYISGRKSVEELFGSERLEEKAA